MVSLILWKPEKLLLFFNRRKSVLHFRMLIPMYLQKICHKDFLNNVGTNFFFFEMKNKITQTIKYA